MNYGWEFPINAEGGQQEGLNSHGMESFKGDKYEHLPREIIQNSLDAVDENAEEVKVEFTKHIINTTDIPDVETLKSIFGQLMSEEEDDKYHHFYKNAYNRLSNKKISILKISDYGTEGLLGVKDSSKDWEGLLLSSGSNYKPDGSGGTYGLGKNAPFLFSDLYTIIYSTRTNEKEPGKGLMGVSKLASHLNENNEMTRGVGYFRNKKNYKVPYFGDEILPKLTYRDEPGTDILVLGFTDEEDWVDKTIQSVLKNFFVKIINGGLEVKVEETLINNETIHDLMEKYNSDNKFDAYDYYEAYLNKSENCYRKEIQVKDLGKINLTIFLDGSQNRKVLMTRNQGMTIKYLTGFSRMVNFTGVGVVQGEVLNEILSQCEPPAHNEWNEEYYRGERSKKEIEQLLKEMRVSIKDYVNSFEEINHSDEIELKGLNEILGWSEETDELTRKLNKNTQGSNKVARLKVRNTSKGRDEEVELDPEGNKKSKPKKRNKGKDKNKKKKRKNPGKTSTNSQFNKASVQKIRVIGDYHSNEYLIFFTPKTSGNIRLAIKQEGLNGSKYTRMFDEVIWVDKNEEIRIADGITEEFEVSKNEIVRLRLNIKDSRMSKLEVKMYED